MFADRKKTLGFAGVIVAIAIVAAFAASAFMPVIDTEEEPVVQAEGPAETPKPKPTQAAVSWAEDGLADDWGADAPGSSSGRSSSSGDEMTLESPEFGDYQPQSSGPPSRSGARGSGSRSTSGPTVISRAAPGAGTPSVPGGGARNDGEVARE